jgi:phospholipid transport system substrate-binding protein
MRHLDRRHRWLWVPLLLLGAAANASGESIPPASANKSPKVVVTATIDEVLAVLKDANLSKAEKRTRLESVAYQRFDFGTISKLVLARNWRRLSPQQRIEFEEEFKRHLSLTYSDTIDEYRDEEIRVEGSRTEPRGDVTVRTRIEGGSADSVLVDYRLRTKADDWFVIDVIIEGVSMIANFRTQIQEIIDDVGPDGVLERMRKKNDEREAKG